MKTIISDRLPLSIFKGGSFSPFIWPMVASLSIVTAIVAAFLVGARHDYAAYMAQWDLILSGGDPWSTNNAYGPAYNLLAGPFALHPMLPKVIFVFAWQVSSWYLVHQLARRGIDLPWLIFWFTVLPFNPLFWTFGVVYGSVDSLVAALCLSALAWSQAGRHSAAAFALALAVLLKIYPIVLAPFLTLDGRRINWQFLTTFVALIATGLTLSFLVWGESTFYSITHNSSRGSKILSIFRFLRGDASPLKGWVDNLDNLSLPAMAFGGGLVFALAWKWRLPPVSGALAGILVTLLLYKVGHQQFFLVVPLVVGLWYLYRCPDCDRLLSSAMVVCLAWLAFVSALYLLTHAYNYYTGAGVTGMAGRWAFLRDWVGLPTFVILISMLATLIRYERLRTLKLPYLKAGPAKYFNEKSHVSRTHKYHCG